MRGYSQAHRGHAHTSFTLPHVRRSPNGFLVLLSWPSMPAIGTASSVRASLEGTRIVQTRRTASRQLRTQAELRSKSRRERRTRLFALQLCTTAKPYGWSSIPFDSWRKFPDLRLQLKPTYGVHYSGASAYTFSIYFLDIICPLGSLRARRFFSEEKSTASNHFSAGIPRCCQP